VPDVDKPIKPTKRKRSNSLVFGQIFKYDMLMRENKRRLSYQGVCGEE
jgi:hypothetical protein